MLDCIHLVVVVTRSFAPEVITVVVAPVPPFSVIVALKASVVETSTVVVLSVSLLVLLGSPDIFSDELLCIIAVGVILCCSLLLKAS